MIKEKIALTISMVAGISCAVTYILYQPTIWMFSMAMTNFLVALTLLFAIIPTEGEELEK